MPRSEHDVRVTGKLPPALSGQYVQIGPNQVDATVHAVTLDAGRAVACRERRIIADDVAPTNLVAFGSSILALGDGALAYELGPRLDTVRRVDLAGARRRLAAEA